MLVIRERLQQERPEHENGVVKFAAEETIVFLEGFVDDFFGQHLGEVECGIIEKCFCNFLEGGLAERGGKGDTGHETLLGS